MSISESVESPKAGASLKCAQKKLEVHSGWMRMGYKKRMRRRMRRRKRRVRERKRRRQVLSDFQGFP